MQLEGVHYRYRGAPVPALKDISLSIPEGRCFGLLGPNGAGKTTLISLLTGLLRPQQGHISVGQHNLPRGSGEIKKFCSLVPQEYAFYPALTGRENLAFFASLYQLHGETKTARIEECVSICGLSKVLDKRAQTYSGGIKRRLNLALGLLNFPRVLYLDEPTVGIDAQSRHFILEAIERLQAGGMTIVYTSHYMEEVEQICDEVAIIDDGRLILQDSMTNLLQGTRELFITPVCEPSAEVLGHLAVSSAARWDGVRLIFERDSDQPLSQLLAVLEDSGVEIGECHTAGHRLEQLYLAATHKDLRQ